MSEKAKRETVLVGGRMQKNAKQARKKTYYKSEAMAIDVLDNVCAPVKYKGSLLTKSHSHVVKMKARGEKVGSLLGDYSDKTGKSLKAYCEMVVEEHEEELKEKMFEDGQEKTFDKWLCVERA